MKVAITGGTGFVGTRLVEKLQAEGHATVVLTRNADYARRVFPTTAFPNVEVVTYAPLETAAWYQAIAGCDGVVNLSGEPIAEKRWTPEQKQLILNSRKIGTQKLVEAIAQANPQPSVFVSTSAIGYYGTSETLTFEESSPSGNDFLAQVCQEWEREAQRVKDFGVRLAILRMGIVLGNGGAIAKMLPPFKMFAGGPIGSGRQWFSWIHREDAVNLILQALSNSQMEGVFNATAPNPVRMSELSNTLGQVLHRPSWFPVPGFVLEALLGDGAKVVLEGQQVMPRNTLNSGFKYQYPTVRQALEEFL